MKRIIILFFYILGVLALFYYDFFTPPQQEQFISLASSFLQGKLYFSSITFDAATKGGHHYWPLGPFPAVLLMPFVYIFGNFIKQGYILFFLNLMNIFLLFRLAKRITGNLTNSLIISFAIVFSTAYLALALVPWSWYYGQVVGFTLTLLALEAYFFHRRWWLIGSYVGLAYATRVSLISVSAFFILNLLFSDLANSEKAKKIIMLITPIIIAIFVIGFYNYARFENVFETGYSLQPLNWGNWKEEEFKLWSFKYFPTHIYTMFIKMPDAINAPQINTLKFPYLRVDGSGFSILFTSFIFVWILFSDWKKSVVKFATIACATTIFAISGSFTNGGWQYGYRYAIDFYPMLFIILLYSFKSDISYKFLIITILGFLINLHFINTIFYPSGSLLNYFR